MKVKLIIFLTVCSLLSFSEQPKWDVGYIYFDESNTETFLHYLHDQSMPVMNKIVIDDIVYTVHKKHGKFFTTKDKGSFYICNEEFEFDKKRRHTVDTLSASLLDDIPFLNDEFLREWSPRLSKSDLFRKLYIIEKYSQDKIIRTQVYWQYYIE